MDTEDILRNFGRNVVCTQQICGHFSSRLGIGEDVALRMGAAFGSGMGHAQTCGCVTGALLVLGLKYGPDTREDAVKAGEALREQVAIFEEKFLEKYPGLICRDLLGVDISQPEGLRRAMEHGLFSSVCAPMVAATCGILEEMLAAEAFRADETA